LVRGSHFAGFFRALGMDSQSAYETEANQLPRL
jgi:hypothetical protein